MPIQFLHINAERLAKPFTFRIARPCLLQTRGIIIAIMTINHISLLVTPARMPALRTFYKNVLQPIGYTEMIVAHNETYIGFGSDYPYFWLKALPEGQTPVSTHIAFDAPSKMTGSECALK
jgi:hypothetical protein